jgi:16S rRNA (guanine966-N2)-methyltransferase
MFNALGSLGAVEGASVVDLFAGTGALGIEALSRGAAAVTFVEHDRRVVETVRANLESTGLDGGEVVHEDALRWLARAAPFDLALLDPPYAFDAWDLLFERLPATLAAIESDREVDPGEGWQVLRTKRYGGTVVTLARRRQTTR